MNRPLLTYLSICLTLVRSLTFAQPNPTTYVPKAMPIVPAKATGFVAGQVKLLDGPFKESQDAEAKNLLSLDVDRLLAPFIISSGAIPKQPMYLGWESYVLPGVALSFYLSGVSRMYRITGDKTYADRLQYVLDQLDICQKKNDGYLLGTLGGKNIFARVEKEGSFPGFGIWGRGEATPYYSLEKLMSGLRDVYRITNNPKALQISLGIGNWLASHMDHLSETTLQQLMKVEYGGMNWVLADLYADTGDKRFLALSNRWQDSIVVVPMTKGHDVLKGKHANMQFPKISGLAARYPFSGKASDLTGATFFWDQIVNHRSFVTGGNSESEYLGAADSLSHHLTPFTEENCNEYNMLRLTKLLFEIEPKVAYADYLERTLFNHILSAQNPTNGQLCYFLPLMPGAKREYQPLEFFSCCTASGLDSYMRHGEYIYSHSDAALYVNLFIASEVNWAEKGISLKQETRFPDTDESTLTVGCDGPKAVDLAIRNPYWANPGVTILINGRKEKVAAAKDGYFHINRTWHNGDRIDLTLPMTLRTESMPDDKNRIALFHGPILLAADLTENQGKELVHDEVAPALVPGKLAVSQWLKPSGIDPLTYVTTVSKPDQVQVMPLYRKKQGEFSVYWQVLTEAAWQQRMATKQAKAQQDEQLDRITIDQVNVNDGASESKHNLFGESTTGFGNRGILMDTKWRRSTTEAMGYELAVSASATNVLSIKCIGKGKNEIWNCRIAIDGEPIQTLKLADLEPYTVNIWQAAYPIPIDLTKGKKTVKVTFEPVVDHKMQMPRLVELRMVKQR